MKIGPDFFCNVCTAAIPDGEPTHEFTTSLLDQKGHCHAECLAQRNAILGQFDETVMALGALLDPGIPSAPKTHQAILVEGNRTGPLKRAPKKDRPPRAQRPRGVILVKMPKKRGRKRGA